MADQSNAKKIYLLTFKRPENETSSSKRNREVLSNTAKQETAKEAKYKCDFCCKKFTAHSSKKRHEGNIHPFKNEINKREVDESKPFACCVCKHRFTLLVNCRRHEKKHHGIESKKRKGHDEQKKKNPNKIRKIVHNCRCPECRKVFTCKSDFMKHFEEHSDISIKTQNKTFQSHGEFIKWKNDTEKKTASLYVLKHKYKTKTSTVHSYECHRSGKFKTQSKGQRSLRKGSNKIDALCPASMLYKVPLNGESIEVQFTSTHVGHQCEYGRLRLSKEEKDEIAQYLKSGLTLQQILVKIKENVTELSRLSLTTKQDIRNVAAEYKINSVEQLETEFIQIETVLNENFENLANSRTEDGNRENAAIDEILAKITSDYLKEEAKCSFYATLSEIESCTTDEEYKLIIDIMSVMRNNLKEIRTKAISKCVPSPTEH